MCWLLPELGELHVQISFYGFKPFGDGVAAERHTVNMYRVVSYKSMLLFYVFTF